MLMRNHGEPGPSGSAACQRSSAPWLPRLLIIDHDDSYTLNILVTLLQAARSAEGQASPESDAALARRLLARTLIVRHTDPLLASPDKVRKEVLPHFDAIILSPGPGRPDTPGDFDVAAGLLASFRNHAQDAVGSVVLPTLGLCLGHQGIATAFGGKLRRARHLRHGLVSTILPSSGESQCRRPGLFEGDRAHGTMRMTTYNSLVVEESSLAEELVVTAFANDASPLEHSDSTDVDRVVMALQHKQLPIWGVQFHLEAIESQDGCQIMRHFLRNVQQYWQTRSASTSVAAASAASQRLQVPTSDAAVPEWLQRHSSRPLRSPGHESLRKEPTRFRIVTRKIGQLPARLASKIFEEHFAVDRDEPAVWLDSARPGGEHSRYSFMARPSWSVHYNIDTKQASLRARGQASTFDVDDGARSKEPAPVTIRHGLPTPRDSRSNSPTDEAERIKEASSARLRGFWEWLDSLQTSLRADTDTQHPKADVGPFLTGFIGYMGYEMKDESLPPRRDVRRDGTQQSDALPTAAFGFCNHLLALDNDTEQWTAIGLVEQSNVQFSGHTDRAVTSLKSVESTLRAFGTKLASSLGAFDDWVTSLLETFQELEDSCDSLGKPSEIRLPLLKPVDDRESYCQKVEAARELIAQGQSYEICLTTEFRGRMQESAEDAEDELALYRHLRGRNPAPYSAFVRLDGAHTILSTSPEKFMSVDARSGLVEMKPIKGTSPRAGYSHDPDERRSRIAASHGDSDAQAWIARLDESRRKSLQMDAKERAENVMIVDLIRRDLLAFCSPETVSVPKLMSIESYETVHQLVTTVQGRKPDSVGPVEALARCYPPGSMTGAPKIRSVQLLEALEKTGSDGCEAKRDRRGAYSGVLGWIGIDGSASFNVLIRTVVVSGRDVSVGAGGAITYLSSAEREWQEVLDKVGALAEVDLS